MTEAPPKASPFTGEKIVLEDILKHAESGGTPTRPLHEQQSATQGPKPASPFAAAKTNPQFNLGGPDIDAGKGPTLGATGPSDDNNAFTPPPPVNNAQATAEMVWLILEMVVSNLAMVIAMESSARPFRLGKENKQEWMVAAVPYFEQTQMELPPWVPLAVITVAMVAATIGTAYKIRTRKKKAMAGARTHSNVGGPGTVSDVELEEEPVETFVSEIDLQREEDMRNMLADIQHQCQMKGISPENTIKRWDKPTKGKCWYHWFFHDQEMPAKPGGYFMSTTGKGRTFSNTFNGLKAHYNQKGIPWLPDQYKLS